MRAIVLLLLLVSCNKQDTRPEYIIAFKSYQEPYEFVGRANVYYKKKLKFVDVVHGDGADYIVRLLIERQDKDTYAKDIYVTREEYHSFKIGDKINLSDKELEERFIDNNNYIKTNS